MSTVRLRRLQADCDKLRQYIKRQPRVRMIQCDGDPPERYQLEYQIKGLRQVDDRLQEVSSHIVDILLPRNYPRMPPQCRMLTPIFHPNIAPHAICIGDHWSAGEPLWSMVARIGEMIAYQSYNTKSPLNGEAARWVEQNIARLPLDVVNMSIDEPIESASTPESESTFPQSGAAVPSGLTAERIDLPAAPPAPEPVIADPPRPIVADISPLDSPAAPTADSALLPSSVLTAIGASPPNLVETQTVSAGDRFGPAPNGDRHDVRCPDCNAIYRVPLADAVKRMRCRYCRAIITIPAKGDP
jgi:ubiquitin-protein ligase